MKELVFLRSFGSLAPLPLALSALPLLLPTTGLSPLGAVDGVFAEDSVLVEIPDLTVFCGLWAATGGFPEPGLVDELGSEV
jgi:hypothetical protein